MKNINLIETRQQTGFAGFKYIDYDASSIERHIDYQSCWIGDRTDNIKLEMLRQKAKIKNAFETTGLKPTEVAVVEQLYIAAAEVQYWEAKGKSMSVEEIAGLLAVGADNTDFNIFRHSNLTGKDENEVLNAGRSAELSWGNHLRPDMEKSILVDAAGQVPGYRMTFALDATYGQLKKITTQRKAEKIMDTLRNKLKPENYYDGVRDEEMEDLLTEKMSEKIRSAIKNGFDSAKRIPVKLITDTEKIKTKYSTYGYALIESDISTKTRVTLAKLTQKILEIAGVKSEVETKKIAASGESKNEYRLKLSELRKTAGEAFGFALDDQLEPYTEGQEVSFALLFEEGCVQINSGIATELVGATVKSKVLPAFSAKLHSRFGERANELDDLARDVFSSQYVILPSKRYKIPIEKEVVITTKLGKKFIFEK